MSIRISADSARSRTRREPRASPPRLPRKATYQSTGQGYYRDAPPGADDKKFAGNLSFYPSPTFAGYRAGMVFRRGERGQGYYKDNPCGGVPIGQRWQRYNPFA